MQLIWSRTYNFFQMHNRSHFCKGSQLPTRRAADRHKLSQSLEGTVALPKSEVPSLLCSAGPSCGSQPDGAPADTPQMFINITQTALTICHQSSRAPEKQRAALQTRHSPEQHQNNHQTHLTGSVSFLHCAQTHGFIYYTYWSMRGALTIRGHLQRVTLSAFFLFIWQKLLSYHIHTETYRSSLQPIKIKVCFKLKLWQKYCYFTVCLNVILILIIIQLFKQLKE